MIAAVAFLAHRRPTELATPDHERVFQKIPGFQVREQPGDGEIQKKCGEIDRPIAALLRDLKQRGLLDDTLVVWGGEFGRTPQSEKGDGRDHNPTGFTMWMAGGGVKGGQVIGATDEVGLRAVEDRLHVHDLHATILWLMGLDNMGLVYKYKGRPERPTLNEGEAFKRIAGA